MTKFRVGVDIGGTFTDIVFLGEDGRRLTKKVSSTVDNYATAIVDGLAELIRERGLDEAEIVELLHGTTVASNAILELKGARTGLITTKGFRDVLEIRTLRMPRLYDLMTCPGPSRRPSSSAICASRSTNASTPKARWSGRWPRPMSRARSRSSLMRG
jgi:N-methylhydantoinase A/oxoprolinase/acetone carboxylase beta subunit